ncbi:MAG TPA: HAD hydrolase family protein [Gemmataceae bacterium]|jgi:3-deoxy-D-manno-octulosonate 8-phosphate phosphatase (KDO 8-P phosphatase)|nr:HAD hydrolase family protein [Gemmataceae bacterium]
MITLLDRLQKIDWLVLDVDGVLTDGSITYADHGLEQKSFHVRDGSGMKIWNFLGKKAALITGRSSRIVEIRAKELEITHVMQGATDKLKALEILIKEAGAKAEQMCAVGDDVVDLGILHSCGLAIAVADACPEARQAAHYVTRARGGRAAVREVIELVLQAQGAWQSVVQHFGQQMLA